MQNRNKKEKSIGGTRQNLSFIIAGAVALFACISFMVFLTYSISDSAWAGAISSSREVTLEKSNVISKEIDQRMTEIKAVLGYAEGLFTTNTDWYEAFEGVTDYNNFLSCKRLYYKDSQGKKYNQSGMVVSDFDPSLASVMNGESVTAAQPYYDSSDGMWALAIAYRNESNKNITLAVGIYDIYEIYKDYNFNEELSANTYVVDGAGNVVLSLQSPSDNPVDKNVLFEAMKKDGITYSFENMLSSATEDGKDVYVIRGDQNAYTIVGNTLNNATDWHIVSVISNSTVDSLSDGLTSQAKLICTALSVFIFLIILLLFLFYTKDRKRTEYNQQYDTVADCPSQSKFEMDTERIISSNLGMKFALIYLDIINYKYIIQLYGFSVENQIIKAFSDSIKRAIKRNEVYGRLNNGKMIVLANYKTRDEIIKTIDEIAAKMKNSDAIEKSRYDIRIAGGIYCIDNAQIKQMSISEMIDKAAFAQQSIKEDSKFNYVYYDHKSYDALLKVSEVESLMKTALADREFKLYLQPKYNIKHNRIDGAEALVRWDRPDAGLILPDTFIPIFEKNRFISSLDRFMLEETCKTINRMTHNGKRALVISVNVSRVTAEDEDFLDFYINMKNKYKVADGFIELEFTESMALESYDFLRKNIEVLRENGFRTSIDDFGQGYSSFKALKALPFDVMKLDKFFLTPGSDAKRDEKLLASVIDLAHSLGMKTVMEGVETQDMLDYLRHMECDTIQGYIYARPMKKDDFEDFVQKAYEKKVKRGPLGETMGEDFGTVL